MVILINVLLVFCRVMLYVVRIGRIINMFSMCNENMVFKFQVVCFLSGVIL